MLKLYKRLYAAYLIISLTGAFGLIIAFAITTQSTFVPFIIAAIWIVSCAVFFNTKAVRRYNNNVAPLYNNCRIRDYIAENEKLLAKGCNRANRNFLMINLVGGYYQLGNMDQAKQILFQINPDFGTKANGLMTLAIYYNDLAALYISFSDFERAKKAIASLQSILNNPAIKRAQHAVISQQIEEINMVLDIKQNNYDGAKKFFALRLSTETPLLKKVRSSYHLANICLHFNETEEAYRHLHFVTENGGDTFYVGKANEILLNL